MHINNTITRNSKPTSNKPNHPVRKQQTIYNVKTTSKSTIKTNQTNKNSILNHNKQTPKSPNKQNQP